MHIPDGFLDPRTAAATGALAAVGVGAALVQARRLPRRRVPLLGTAAAFLFVAQMLNFPVAAGTSGHLIGGALVAILLSPAAAVIVVTSVLIVQCLLFADGGVTALGANVLNMAVLGVLAGYLPYRALRGVFGGERGRIAAAAFAGWCSTVVAAVACAGELATAGTARWGAVFPAMAGVHLVIGLGEGAITALVVAAVLRLRPELADDRGAGAKPGALVVAGLAAALALALFVAPFASGLPDGLERVAETLGFPGPAAAPIPTAPIPDYAIPGIGSPVVAVALAGVVGAAVVFALSWLLAAALVRSPSRRAS